MWIYVLCTGGGPKIRKRDLLKGLPFELSRQGGRHFRCLSWAFGENLFGFAAVVIEIDEDEALQH